MYNILFADGPLMTLCRNCLSDMDFIQSALATKLMVSLLRNNGDKVMNQREMMRYEAADSVHALLMMLAPSSGKSKEDRRAFQVRLLLNTYWPHRFQFEFYLFIKVIPIEEGRGDLDG